VGRRGAVKVVTIRKGVSRLLFMGRIKMGLSKLSALLSQLRLWRRMRIRRWTFRGRTSVV
jgi:hypothetical protein